MNWPFSTVRPQALRAEIYQLGGRHMGEPLAGAVLELADTTITPQRRRLLEAVVQALRPAPVEPHP
jgi:hypothetical protein